MQFHRRDIEMRTLVAILALGIPAHAQQALLPPRKPAPVVFSAQIEAQVSALLRKMTLQEKVGQLVQYAAGNATGPSPKGAIYEGMIRRGEVGSLLNVIGADETNRYQRIAVEESRLHIPLLFGYDVIHGYKTTFPIPLALASTFSPDVIEDVARAGVDEARADGIDWVFSPMVDVARDARWGRMAESNGEDPLLGSIAARAWVDGIQHARADGTFTAACVKHFAAYGAPVAGRDYNAVDMSPNLLNTVYLPPYRAGVDAGAMSVMSSFNSLNGIPMTANRHLLTETLRGEWGFPGLVVSDWGAVRELQNHSVALDGATAAAKALHAGVDIEMEGDLYNSDLAWLVDEGRVSMDEVDDAVRRVLRVKFAIGLFAHPYTESSSRVAVTPASRKLAREVAAETLVLLKNEKKDGKTILPLSESTRSVALIGPFADSQTEMLGSWSLPADSHGAVTLRAAMQERLCDRLHYVQGTEIVSDSTAGFAKALDAARKADVVVMTLGESGPGMTGEATSRAHLGLPGNQEALLEAVSALGKPVIVVLFSGRALAIPWAAQHVPAIMEAWFPGMEGGHAIADVLFGGHAPEGRLPVSFPYSVGQEPLYYAQLPTGRPATADLTGPVHKGVSRFSSRYIDEATIPLFPFGWGLTYTHFDYGVPKLDRSRLSLSDIQRRLEAEGRTARIIGVNVTLTNSGARAGTEVVQLYLRNRGASVEQPVRQLRHFLRVTLEPHQSRSIHFDVTAEDLSFLDDSLHEVIEPTDYDVLVGGDASTTNETTLSLFAN